MHIFLKSSICKRTISFLHNINFVFGIELANQILVKILRKKRSGEFCRDGSFCVGILGWMYPHFLEKVNYQDALMIEHGHFSGNQEKSCMDFIF